MGKKLDADVITTQLLWLAVEKSGRRKNGERRSVAPYPYKANFAKGSSCRHRIETRRMAAACAVAAWHAQS